MKFLPRHFLRAGLGTAGVAGVVLGVSWMAGVGLPVFEDNDAPEVAETVGEIRHETLDVFTASYLATNPNADLILVSGERLAPLKYLNNQLRRVDASWRVSIEDGQVDFREVT